MHKWTMWVKIVGVLGCVLLLISAVIYLVLPDHALATSTTYYISPAGNDNNTGTSPADAWQTVTKVNATTFTAGDQILFAGGQTFTGSIFLDSTDTPTPLSPITISSYGNGRATINGGNDNGMFIYNSAGYNITNLNLVGSGAGINTGSGIGFYADLAGNVKLDHITIDQVEASGFDNGVVIGAWNNLTGFKNVTITHVSAHHNHRGGIVTYSQATAANENVYVGHSTAFQNLGNPNITYNSGSGITLGGINGGVIEYSSAYNNGALCTANECGVGIWTYNSANVTIQFNESYSNKTGSAVDGGGFDLDGGVTNSVLQYNFSHDNDGAGIGLFQYSGAPEWRGNTIRYNISQNDGRKNGAGGISLWNGGNGIFDAKIYNNTIFMSPVGAKGAAKAISFLTSTNNVKFYNNIFITTDGVKLIEANGTQAGAAFVGNSYWPSGGAFAIKWGGTTYTSLNAWRTATGYETFNSLNTGFNVNPQVTNPGAATTIGDPTQLGSLTAYKLLASSPLINQGQALVNFGIDPGGRDFWGTILPQGSAIDIGAHEFTSPPTSPLPSPLPSPTVSPSPSPLASPTPTPTPVATPAADTTPPQVQITFPANNAFVPKSTSVSIAATASDASGIARVEFYVNNILRCADTTTPYSCKWPVPSQAGVAYTLEARAVDTANNTASNFVTVTSQ